MAGESGHLFAGTDGAVPSLVKEVAGYVRLSRLKGGSTSI